jgi:superfamily II DNA or RNA helicase
VDRVDRFIASCPSWNDFWERTRQTSEAEKGRAFERLVQLYLQTAPEYRTILQDVWTLREVPAQVRKLLRLPSSDEGIDLIARTWHREYWAIQSKFRNERDKPLNRTNLGTFHALAFNTCSNIALAVVAHTCTLPVAKHHLMRDTVEIGFDRWQAADWALIVGGLKGESTIPVPRCPRPHQAGAILAAKDHFIRDKAARGRLIMPCGSGKSLAAYWIAQSLEAKTILVAVPSLELIRKSVTDWSREFLANGQVPDWVCVCSDESVGNLDQDEFVSEVYELGLPTLTDPEKIASLLRTPCKGSRIVFTTYQSSKNLADAAWKTGVEFDLVLFDEAHRTVGVRSKPFATLLRNEEFKARRRLFMTATERVLREDNDEVLSMDNEDDYGKCFFQLSYKDAIAQGIISDYKVLTIAISDEEVSRVIEENRILNLHPELDEAEARTVAIGVALKQVLKDRGITHTISFHRSIRAADRFRGQADVLNLLPPQTTNFHISSKQTAGQRAETMREFEREPRALMTNARCLTEGVDVPAIDCVVFADPKQSTIDIVQAAGRALRVSSGKDYGYILLPIVVPDGKNFDEFAETTAFRKIARIVTALSTQDERIADQFRAIQQGRIPTGKIVEIVGNIPVGMHMSLEQFNEAISTRIWASVGRANWTDFEEARAFVRGLGLKAAVEWRDYVKSGKLPPDIPTNPNKLYGQSGWISWGDWLGTGRVCSPDWRPFEEARVFVRSLGFKSVKEWRTFAGSTEKSVDIPSNPDAVYADSGWMTWGDWFGTGRIANQQREYRSFEEARAFARGLGLKTGVEWKDYCKSDKKPTDIPIAPNKTYRQSGWVGWGDWLGTGNVFRRDWPPFKEARALVRSIGLKSSKEWNDYRKSDKRPPYIPTNPHKVYRQSGWVSLGDWLGTNRYRRGGRPFSDARAFVRSLGLKNQTEWNDYCKSGEKPADIPSNPGKTYANSGWIGINDWLGTGWQSFKDARVFVRGLGLKSGDAWKDYCNSGKKPDNIPASPNYVYANSGWVSWMDWLGYDWRPFEEARAFVRGLGLKSHDDWHVYCKSGKKPDNIPVAPHKVYRKLGWVSWMDWLGTDFQIFSDAQAFVRGLGLKSKTEWVEYCRSGKRPSDIPSNPNQVYRQSGWIGWGDWLGTSQRKFLASEKAPAFVHGLDLKPDN